MSGSMRLGDGASLMRASFDVVRANPALLWFPVASTVCLVVVTLFWIFEGALALRRQRAVGAVPAARARGPVLADLPRDLLQRRARGRRGRRAGRAGAVVR